MRLTILNKIQKKILQEYEDKEHDLYIIREILSSKIDLLRNIIK